MDSPPSTKLALIVVAIALLALPAAARATTINVTNTNDSGPGSLRDAIATPGATVINVPAGTITLTSGELVVNQDLVIAGAGPGSTTVSGSGTGRAFLTLGTHTLDLSGMTVIGGSQTGAGATLKGAALFSNGGAWTISHVAVTGAHVDTSGSPGGAGGTVQGGAIFAAGPLTMTDVQVTGTTALANGGSGNKGGTIDGIAVYATGPLTMTNSQVTGASGSAMGGADTGSGTNNGGLIGGAVFAFAGAAITNSQITANSANTSGGPGSNGAIIEGVGLSTEGLTTISGSNLSGNVAVARGGNGPPSSGQSGGSVSGVGAEILGPLTLTDSTISGNSADVQAGPGGPGGAALGIGLDYDGNSSADQPFTNVTIAGNSVTTSPGGFSRAGGAHINHVGTGNVLLTNDTIANNSIGSEALSAGGNLLSATSGGGAVEVVNTIISGGAGPSGSENCSVNPTFTSLGHNIDSLNQCAFTGPGDKVNTNPQLAPPQDNGGPGPTLSFPITSPAFDAGDSTACPSTDERGIPRPRGAACDIGALELELADLGLRNTARSATVPIGNTVIFDLVAADGSPDAALATTITDKLPPGLRLVSTTPACTGAIACPLGDIAAGTARGVTIVARAVKPGLQTTSASVSSSTADPNATNNSASAAVTVSRLKVTSLSILPKTFRLGTKLPKLTKVKTGTKIRFNLPEAATVRIVFAQPRRRRHRTHFVTKGSLTVKGHAAQNVLRFQGRLSRRKSLKPGRYRVTLTAKDAFGNRSKPVSVSIRVLAP